MRNLWPISCLPRPCQLSHKTIYVDQVPVVVQYNTCPCVSGSQGLWICCSVRFIVLIWPLSSSHRNPFCVLKVDNEAVARSVAQLPDALPRLLSRKSMMFISGLPQSTELWSRSGERSTRYMSRMNSRPSRFMFLTMTSWGTSCDTHMMP